MPDQQAGGPAPSGTLEQVAVRELERFFRPLLVAAQNRPDRIRLFMALGWNLPAIAVIDEHLIPTLETVAGLTDKLQTLVTTPAATLPEVAATLGETARLIQAVPALKDAFTQAEVPYWYVTRLPQELVSLLAATYVATYYPAAWSMAQLLTVAGPVPADRTYRGDYIAGSKWPATLPVPRNELKLGVIPELLKDPLGVLERAYITGDGLTTAVGAKHISDKLFPRLAAVLRDLGAIAVYHRPPDDVELMTEPYDPPTLPLPDLEVLGGGLTDRMLAFRFAPPAGENGVSLGALVTLAADEHGEAGVVIAPLGGLQADHDLEKFNIKLNLQGAPVAFKVTRSGLRFPDGVSLENVAGDLLITRHGGSPNQPAFLIGGTESTRLEIGQVQLAAKASLPASGATDFGLELRLKKAALVLAAEKGDGFLGSVLPEGGLRTEFDLILGWDGRRGFYVLGTAGLEGALPVTLGIPPVLTVNTIYLGLKADASAQSGGQGQNSAGLKAYGAVAAAIKLGPLQITIDRIGFALDISFPPDGGNLGALNLAPSFTWPRGAGLAVDAGAVKGGGFLMFNPDEGRYAGVLQLEILETISLKAIGLLDTRMPDGSGGFSLLLIIMADGFTPIQLGYGFTLNGVGGLLGLNRTARVEALQDGVRAGRISSVLSPKDAVAHAPQIISDLQAFFPPAPGQFLIGPLITIGWGGVPSLVTMTLGLFLEFPHPVRLLLLGRILAVLPPGKYDAKAPVRLQMDAFGAIDFDRGDASLDAALVDSYLTEFVITGAMALRANWGRNATFVLAVGGFNPRFKAPAGFPQLPRVAISLAKGDSLRVRLEAYLALTTNTVQFGARIDLFVSVSEFKLVGFLGFDVLIHLNPLRLVADMYGMLALSFDDTPLMMVGLNLTVAGPSPWDLDGKAEFKVLGFKKSVRVRKTIGRGNTEARLPRADLRKELQAALLDRKNWQSQMPAGDAGALVSFRDTSQTYTDPVHVHPLGSMTFRQRSLPLRRNLDHYGGRELEGAHQVAITAVKLDTLVADTSDLSDPFAPAQYLHMSDAEKLSSPSFVEMVAGFRMSYERLSADQGCPAERAYEIVDAELVNG